jgi:protein SCO1/2
MARSVGTATSAQGGDCHRPLNGPNAGYFPNVVVLTHENRRALFYDDLLRGKVVIVNFMSIKDDAVFRSTEKLAQVQAQLGDRLGKDVFMYSITVDPMQDTPQALAEFAEWNSVRPGWLFLTGAPADIETLRNRFFAHSAGHSHNGPSEDCSMSMIRYGNEAVGIWGAVPSASPAGAIAMRISWVQPRPLPVGPPKRKGPLPLEFFERESGQGQ